MTLTRAENRKEERWKLRKRDKRVERLGLDMLIKKSITREKHRYDLDVVKLYIGRRCCSNES